MKPTSEEARKVRGGGCTALPLWRRHTGTLGRPPLGESLKLCNHPIVQTCSRSVGHRLRQALLHPLPGPVPVLKIPMWPASNLLAGLNNRMSGEGPVTAVSPEPVRLQPPKARRRLRGDLQAGRLKQNRSKAVAPGRGLGVEEALHLLLHLRSKQGVESDNSPEANVKIK